jgi:hypothetical protein
MILEVGGDLSPVLISLIINWMNYLPWLNMFVTLK